MYQASRYSSSVSIVYTRMRFQKFAFINNGVSIAQNGTSWAQGGRFSFSYYFLRGVGGCNMTC